MTVLAHFGHWYESLLYLAPLVVLGAALLWSGRADEDEPDDVSGADGRSAPRPALIDGDRDEKR